jgi:hypothetical protein
MQASIGEGFTITAVGYHAILSSYKDPSKDQEAPSHWGDLSNEQMTYLFEIGKQRGFEEAIAAVLARRTAVNDAAVMLETNLMDVLAVEDEDQLIERLKHDVGVMRALNMDRFLDEDSGHPPLNPGSENGVQGHFGDGGAGGSDNSVGGVM